MGHRECIAWIDESLPPRPQAADDLEALSRRRLDRSLSDQLHRVHAPYDARFAGDLFRGRAAPPRLRGARCRRRCHPLLAGLQAPGRLGLGLGGRGRAAELRLASVPCRDHAQVSGSRQSQGVRMGGGVLRSRCRIRRGPTSPGRRQGEATLGMGRLYDATVGRSFTAWYGRLMRRSDESGLRETRRELLREARGRVLDLGSGTGSNLPLFPSAVEELILTEPSAHMLRVLRRKVGESGRGAVELVQAPAESLPFEDASFDCVTCTMVMCTMPDPAAGLEEVARVLKPGGKLLFLEHVRSEDPGFARTQDRLERPWRFIADGCHCNPDSLAIAEG